MDEPNKINAILKVDITGVFYDNEATEETLRYAVEQDLEDAGFDVDVSVLKEREPVKPIAEKCGKKLDLDVWVYVCGCCKRTIDPGDEYCRHCGRKVVWE